MMTKRTLLYTLCLLIPAFLSAQKDNSLTYIDLIVSLNQNIKSDQNTALIMTKDLPIKLDAVKEIKEASFSYSYAFENAFDTVIIYQGKEYEFKKGTPRILKYEKMEEADDALMITDSIPYEDYSITKKLFYSSERLQAIEEEGHRVEYVYYENGELKEINFEDRNFLSSKVITEDSIKYELHLSTGVPAEMKGMTVLLPKIEIYATKDKSSKCYQYENYLTMPRAELDHVMNKRVVLCEDGKYKEELVMERLFSKYKKKESDLNFFYDDLGRLTHTTSKEGVKYPDSWNYSFEYDSSGRLIKDKRYGKERTYEYDERGNIVLIAVRNTWNGRVEKIISRTIIYE
ncbi:MAG: RHS repeat domain-containing protein [Bacteroidota bacterium]